MFCSIYKITNLINGKIYIGQTWQLLRRRWQLHATQRRTKGSVSLVARAIQKYGRECFKLELVALSATQETADTLEKQLIAKFRSADHQIGYNIELGGRTNSRVSQETKDRLRAYRLGRKDSDETRLKKSIAAKGNKANRGKKFSADWREQMSIAHRKIK